MSIGEVIENITEIQDSNWVLNLSADEVEKIESDFWLVWMKLKQIKEPEIIQPLLKISEFLSIKEMKDGRLNVKMRNVEFKHFYSMCISLIPKKKYQFIYPKRKKENKRDYEFLKLLAIEYKESIHNCEDYYDTFDELGILEDEKAKLFEKYGIIYSPESSDIIEIVNINLIIEHPKRTNNKIKSNSKEYIALKENIKRFGLLEPIIVEEKTNYIVCGYSKYQCCIELGVKKVQVIKKIFKFDILDIINSKLDSSTLISEQVNNYRKLRQEILNFGYKKRRALMNGLSMRDYLFQQTGISQTQYYRLGYIEKMDSEIYNKVMEGIISINQGYLELKRLNGTT